MSYSDFLKSTQGSAERPESAASPSPTVLPAPTPTHTIHRKPPANYSPIPFNSMPGSVHKTVTQFNNLRSASASQLPTTSPVSSVSKRAFSGSGGASPVSAMKITAESLPSYSPPPKVNPVSVSPSVPAQGPNSMSNGISDYPPPPAHAEWHAALKQCLALQNDATTYHKKRPFAALLLGPDRATNLLTHFSISHIQHAESELARLASAHYSTEYLAKCTLVSTWEPCAMCAGTIYWSGIGRVVYAASESKLRDLTGPGNTENLTMDLPCRTVFSGGQNKVEVVGPVPGWEDKIVEESRKWWRDHNKSLLAGSVNGHAPASSSASAKSASLRSYTVITNPPPEEGVLSRIGEDGEYLADIKVDWMM